ncbi:MAG: hypothetical protein BYD32DRAFT_416511 [Podila humilis]|nr:MAG: hypothetical protein BYD32DRAFT_416511 [Podila humilis]
MYKPVCILLLDLVLIGQLAPSSLPLPHSPVSSYGFTLDRNEERPWTSVCSEMFPAFLLCSMDQWIGESPDYSLSFRFFGCTFQLINSRRPGRILPLAYASVQERDNIFLKRSFHIHD